MNHEIYTVIEFCVVAMTTDYNEWPSVACNL